MSALSPLALETDVVQRAKCLAQIAHYGVKNHRNGESYILHPHRVSRYTGLALIGLNESDRVFLPNTEVEKQILAAIGWLHDTIEDTWVTFDLVRDLFGETIADAVLRLTKTPGMSDAEYFEGINGDDRTVVVKFADMMDNFDPKRLAALGVADKMRLEHKYRGYTKRLNVEQEMAHWHSMRTQQRSPEPSPELTSSGS